MLGVGRRPAAPGEHGTGGLRLPFRGREAGPQNRPDGDRAPTTGTRSDVPRRLGPMSSLTPAVPGGIRAGRVRVRSYVALTKPRIIELLLVTTLPTMLVARRGVPSVWLMLATLLGGALAAGGANAMNMVLDRDIDKVMHRTRNRPLVTGEVTPRAATVFAVVLEVAAFAELWSLVNLLSAVLAVAATAFYIV